MSLENEPITSGSQTNIPQGTGASGETVSQNPEGSGSQTNTPQGAGTSGETVSPNPEGLGTQTPETVGDGRYQQLQDKIDTILDQEGVLENIDFSGSFAEYLDAHGDFLAKLKQYVDKSRERVDLTVAERNAIDRLAVFLNDIDNADRMQKDYDEFMRKLHTPKKLNTMTKAEIRRVGIYLGKSSNVNKAWEAYEHMRDTKDKFEEKGMKKQDQEFFNNIWQILENTYKNNDTFVENEYPAVKSLLPTVSSLKSFAGESWTGEDITDGSVPDSEKPNSFVEKTKVVAKFNEKNTERKSNNERVVSAIQVEHNPEDFKKDTDGNFYYKDDQNPFDADRMLVVYKDNIQNQARVGTEFVGDEMQTMIEAKKQVIFDNMKLKLAEEDIQQQTPPSTPPSNPGENNPEVQGETTEFTVGNDIIKIKDPALKDAITKDPTKFCDSLEGDEVKFNIEEVKKYLETLKDKPRKEFKALKGVEKETWIIAVQIALIYLNKKDGGDFNGSCDVEWIDGIRGRRTIAGVKGFQEKWNSVHASETPLNKDGAPGKHTITAILGELGDLSTHEGNEGAEGGGQGDVEFEGLGRIKNGRMVFEASSGIQEQTDNDGNIYIEVDSKTYQDYKDGMTGLGYKCGIENGVGWFYMGDFKDGKMEGRGTYTYANGNKYEGDFKDGKMEGRGTYTYANGNKYEGDFKGDRFEGSGTLTTSGFVDSGEFKNGELEGEGTTTYSNGSKYEGEYEGGKMTSGKFTLGGKEYQVVRDNNLMKIESGPDNVGKFIDQNASNGPEIVDGSASS